MVFVSPEVEDEDEFEEGDSRRKKLNPRPSPRDGNLLRLRTSGAGDGFASVPLPLILPDPVLSRVSELIRSQLEEAAEEGPWLGTGGTGGEGSDFECECVRDLDCERERESDRERPKRFFVGDDGADEDLLFSFLSLDGLKDAEPVVG